MMRAHLLALGVLCACGNVPAAPDAQTELCFDGEDNDADTLIDCADPDCDPTAVCVPSTTEQPAGVVVAGDQPCPAGFSGGETVIHRGLQPGGCTGCGCTPGTTTCEAAVWLYTVDHNECPNDLALTGGTPVGYPITVTCNGNEPLHWPMLYGARADVYVLDQTCAVDGTPAPETSTWSETVKFCHASSTAAGCAAAETCAPRAASAAAQCALADGAASCEGYSQSEDWFSEYDDQRTCGACFCSPVGGNCDNMVVQIGSDYSCGNHAQVGDDQKNCFPDSIYAPPAGLIGTPTPPNGCTADAPISGTIEPSGQKTLCCVPT
jgi:hypothetical protein